jgi:predicted GH43/DUF377 family glycosyl hydrolase
MKTQLVGVSLLILTIAALAMVPFAGAQEGPSFTVDLTPYEGNPILCIEGAQAWEQDAWDTPSVIVDDEGQFHMFYIGHTADVGYAGYATSEDGLHWARYEGNPVFVPDETVAPADGILHNKVYLDGETWVMLFVPALEKMAFSEVVLRATAPDPTGPWSVDPEPVFTAGEVGTWDSGGIFVHRVLSTDDGYVMYYHPFASGIGMATSQDGIEWTRYDNPDTDVPPYVGVDPVFTNSDDTLAWDWWYVSGSMVRQSEDGWEMFYSGQRSRTHPPAVGYATSEDGIAWTRQGDAPVLGEEVGASPDSLLVIDDTYYLYYNYWIAPHGCVGVAIGTVTRE